MIKRIETPTPFAVGSVNCHLLKGDALSIVDVGTKTDEALEAIRVGLKQEGYRLEDIEQVILTHHHPDHIGWTDAFPNAEIMGHIYNDAWLRRDPVFIDSHYDFYMHQLQIEGVPEKFFEWPKRMTRRPHMMGTRPLTRILKEGDEVPGHKGLYAIETLGHAQSHLAYWHEDTKQLLGGDLLISHTVSNPLIEPPLMPNNPRAKSLLQYNASLKKVLDLPVEIVHSGHGAPILDAHALIEERLERQHRRALKVLQIIEELGPITVYELSAKIFPTKYETELGLTLSHTVGQVDYLQSLGHIVETSDERGVLHYVRA
ncbi:MULTISPECIES: MBL fold metallo-hydrolase [Kurthia]|uniref:MBL fold metallo-hydrolase n=1 Tax=Kurthia gibsonii TaxID=33946 RepID=A0ABU9LK29_9BACL|nr:MULTISPECIES: MBL fold metallo-hydrolase [Kurthia]AMA64459.1 metallo-beta-lactamase superfamily protein [Kurthia sp. 11kri321]MEB6112377.1 MBL fold metallo-hydrolase [Kurthia gibsonii]HZG10717.1 MBL fold metallo-hydrolase [Kurthia gibsonii]